MDGTIGFKAGKRLPLPRLEKNFARMEISGMTRRVATLALAWLATTLVAEVLHTRETIYNPTDDGSGTEIQGRVLNLRDTVLSGT
jgi:hypothetical protein